MPGEGASEEVEQHISQGLDVVPPALLNTQVGVDAGIPGCACQVFVLTVGYVDVGLGVPELLGQAEVDDVHLMVAKNASFTLTPLSCRSTNKLQNLILAGNFRPLNFGCFLMKYCLNSKQDLIKCKSG